MKDRNWFFFTYYHLYKLVTFVALGYITAIWVVKFPLGLVYRVINGKYAGSFYSIEYIVTFGGILLLILIYLYIRNKPERDEANLTKELNKVMREEGF